MPPPYDLVLLVGPDHDIDALAAAYQETRLPHIIIGDGTNPITTSQLLALDGALAPDARIDIWTHGTARTGQHAIELTSNKADHSTSDLFKTLRSFTHDASNLQVHLWSCYGGAAASNAGDLPENTVLITHASAEHVSYKNMNEHGIRDGIKAYSADKNPFRSFARSLTSSPETATLTTMRDEHSVHFTARCARMPLGEAELKRDLQQRLSDYAEQIRPLHLLDIAPHLPSDHTISQYQKNASIIAQNLQNADYISRYLTMPHPRSDLLSFAASHASTHVLSTILADPRTDPNGQNINDETALHTSVYYSKHTNTQRLLAEPSIDPNIKDESGSAPLHLAAASGDLASLRLLLSHKKTDIDAVDNEHRTALHRAVLGKHPAIVWDLIERGARGDLTDNNHRAPLRAARAMPPAEPKVKETLIALLTPLSLTSQSAPIGHDSQHYDPSITTLRLHFRSKRARHDFTQRNTQLFDALRNCAGRGDILTITQINTPLDNAPTDVGLNISWNIDIAPSLVNKMSHITQRLTAHYHAAAEAAKTPRIFTDLIKKKEPLTAPRAASPTASAASSSASSTPQHSPTSSPRSRYLPPERSPYR